MSNLGVNIMPIVAFHAESKLACFKRYYSTASVLTFDVPPKTALVGLIGGILGYERRSEEFISLFDIKTSVIINRPVHKMMMGLNLLNTKSKGKVELEIKSAVDHVLSKTKKDTYAFVGAYQHTQINTQVLVSPSYLICALFPDDLSGIAKEFEDRVRRRYYSFTPYLGRSEHICHLTYINIEKANIIGEETEIHSTIPTETDGMEFEAVLDSITTGTLILDTLPHSLEPIGKGKKRKYAYTFEKYMYQRDGQPLVAKSNVTHELDLGEAGVKNVIFS